MEERNTRPKIGKIFPRYYQQYKTTLLFLVVYLAFGHFVHLHLTFGKETRAPTQELQELFLGDLPAMKARHMIRALVTYNKTNFFIVKGQPYGFEYDLLQAYAKWLNQGSKKRQIHTRMVFILVPFDQLLTGLVNGKGDIAASGLTITPERSKSVNFTLPYVPNVEEIVVMNKTAKGLDSLQDLQGKSVFLAKGTQAIHRISND